jgi:hypothetical protein
MVAIVTSQGHYRTRNHLLVGTGGTVTDHDRLIAGRYRLGEQIGVGAMGIVWRARDERLRRTVAVKQLLLQPGLDEQQAADARARAMREARIAARLQHQNVVIVYDVVEDGGAPWLIMEYVPSRSLAMVMREAGPLPPYQVADIGAQAAAGLAAAHAVGVIHRDVKPGNVLLGDDGTVKITDFGISRAVDDAVLTATGLITGTPAYLAPELAKGGEPAPSSDVFALGSTLYAAVQGTPPFGFNENPLALLYIVANGTVSPPPNGGPLTPVLMRLLGTVPHDRPTMRQVHADLAALAAQRTIVARAPVGPDRAWTTPAVEPVPVPEALLVDSFPEPPRARRRAVRLAMVVVIALVAVGAAVFVVDRAGRGTSVQAAGPSGAVVAPPVVTSVAPAVPSLAAMRGLVTRYYGLLPGDLNGAYQLLSARFRAKVTFDQFRGFYVTIAQVVPNDFHQTGPNTITAVINFAPRHGAVTHEPYRFTVVARDGALLIDDAVPVGRVGRSN